VSPQPQPQLPLKEKVWPRAPNTTHQVEAGMTTARSYHKQPSQTTYAYLLRKLRQLEKEETEEKRQQQDESKRPTSG
jgi:hypothetical protein